MRQKKSFMQLIKVLGVTLMIGVGASIMVFNFINALQELTTRTQQMRTEFIARQKELIRHEVKRAIAMIKHEQNRSLSLAKETVKARVYEACAIAESIYKHYNKSKSTAEIQEIIIEVLRPLRFDNGSGYFFIRRADGISMLQPIYPEMEGRGLDDISNPEKRAAAKNILELAGSHGEGFYEYRWDKPLKKKEPRRKITFVKFFPTYNWGIGSGVYLEDIQKPLTSELLQRISQIRYGKEGYIFINRFNGDALLSNGRVMQKNEKLWGSFAENHEQVKELFAKEYAAALKPEGDYIYYSWRKLTNPDLESPKTSFIQGLPELQWLVGAGVYLDDAETDIALLQSALRHQIKKKMLYSFLLTLGVITIFLFLFNRLSLKLQNDFSLFLSFFDRAASRNETINRDLVKLREFDRMAETANLMLDKLKCSETRLRENEQRLRTLINTSPDIICFKDGQGRWLEANDADLKLFSLTGIDYRGKTDTELAELTAPIYRQSFLNCELSDEIAWQTETSSRIEESILREDGSLRVFDIIKVAVFNPDGSRKGLVVLGRDVTDQKQTEAELQKMVKLESLGTLAGGIAHDFNNILMGLFGNLSIARDYLEKTHPARKALEDAEKSMSRATRLTRQLLTFAKGGAPIREDVSLGELVEEIVRFDLSGSNVKPLFKQTPDLWLAEVDKGQIQQVFSNLAINANQAMPDGGYLNISLSNVEFSTEVLPGLKSGRYIKAEVRDQGCGIDHKHLERIFDPYFSTKQSGSGLGLATTYSIINRHGGHISVDSEPGKGSIFTLYLPASERKTLPASEQPATSTPASGKKCKVLVMDDEVIIREVVTQMLQRDNYDVETVENGDQAVAAYRNALDRGEPFAVVILDLTIPGGMGGQETIRQILALDPAVRAIVSSGYADDPVMANYREYGFCAVAAKPYSLKQLLEVLDQVIK
ncbi:MAG: cache domain-containing protein [Deltaproteobacteria bacterium]|nr:cache domain-containing protein [Deltaproteobacteria bacterium]